MLSVFSEIHGPRCLAALAALFGCAVGGAQDKAPAVERPAIDLSFTIDGESFSATIRGDDDAVLKLDGSALPEDRVERSATGWLIHDRFGAVIAEICVDPQGASVRCFTADRRPYVGVDLQPLGPALAGHLGLEPARAAHIVGIRPGSPAEVAGLEKHDIITHFDGHTPVTPEVFQKCLDECEPGDKVTLRILRRGEPRAIEVELGRAPRATPYGFLTRTAWRARNPVGPADVFTKIDPSWSGRIAKAQRPFTFRIGDKDMIYVTPDDVRSLPPGYTLWGRGRTAKGAGEPGASEAVDPTEAPSEVDGSADEKARLREQIDRLDERIRELEELIRALRSRRDN